MKRLTPVEQAQARTISIWRVFHVAPQPEESENASLVHPLRSYHLTEASALEDQERRGGPPGAETAGFDVRSCSLLEGWEAGAFSIEEVRAQLAREFGPLAEEEAARAARTRIWTVWYEDRFHFGAERDLPVPVAHFVTRADAEADAEARGGQGELAGYDVGYGTILEGLRGQTIRRNSVARELLRKAMPLEKEMLARVYSFIARELGAAAKGELRPETRLVGDLGLSGREGARVMASFFREFSVDPEGFEITRYFAAELIGLFGTTTRLSESGRPGNEISLDDLLTAALLGRWDVELPEPPK